MTPLSRTSFLRYAGLLPVAALFFAAQTVAAQTSPAAQPQAPAVQDRASAYYHAGLAHLYEEMAVNAGRPDYATQAVEEYKLALNADPNSMVLQDGLANLYFKLGRIREAISAAQDQVKKNPDDVDAHTLLGKIYLRSLGDMQTGQSTQMLQLAIHEYEKLAELKPKDIETHLLLGQLYGLDHDTEKAEAQFKTAQKIDGTSEEVVLNMARLYSEHGDLQRAADVLAAVPPADRTARIEYSLGSAYDQLKKPKLAIAAYRSALELDPDNQDIERGLANALFTDSQLSESLKYFQQIVAAEPQDAQSQIRIAEIQRRQGHYDASLATLKKTEPLASDSEELRYNEALVYDSLGRYDDAVTVLNKLLADSVHANGEYAEGEKTNRSIFLDRLGIVYTEQNKFDQAVDAYKQMTVLGGEYAARGYQGQVDAYRAAHEWKKATAVAAEAARVLPKNRGVQLMYAGQLTDTGEADKGLAIANAQLDGSSDDRDTHIAIAQMDVRLKHWKDAADHLDKAEALAKKPDDKVYIYFVRGTLYDREKMFDQAEAQFRKALAIEPQNAMILNYLGYMLADKGVRLSEALSMIQKAVDLDPQNGAYLDSLGWVYYKSGQYTLAEENLQKANERINTDPTVHDHLGEVYEKTGRLKQAVSQWERSLTEYAHSLPADADPADVAKVQHKLENARVKLARLSSAPGDKDAK